ncbi:MAG: hypothetical protein WBY94_06785 [Polyangiaceae bacterium]
MDLTSEAQRKRLADTSLPAIAILTTIVGAIKEAEILLLRPMTAEETAAEGMTVVEETVEEETTIAEEIWALNAPAAESAFRAKLEARAVSAGVVTWDRTSIRAITLLP